MNENETNAAPIVPPTSASGCSKSESATPLTDAVFAKCKARPSDGIGSRDGGWGAADIADFLRHSRKLETALGGAVSALRDISGAKAADDVPLYAKSFELLGRIQGIASVALDAMPIVPPTSSICPTPRASGCSKSESDTPRTDTFYDDHLDFGYYESDEWHKFASQLERELAVARKGLEAVESLMNESHGVGGLHLNGDFAPWSELRTGGRFEEWLIAFDDALNAARSSNPNFQAGGTL